MKKLTVLAAGAIGYVLGTRAGRERYEQIKQQATKTWNRPTVQGAVDDVEQAVRHTASDVGSKVASAAGDAQSKVSAKIKGDDPTTSTTPPPATPPASPPPAGPPPPTAGSYS